MQKRHNEALQPSALWRCASMSILISVRLTVAQPRSQSGKPRKLAAGRTALLWSFAPGTQIKRQVNLTFRSGSYVVALVGAVDGTHSAANIERFLTRIANSFHAK